MVSLVFKFCAAVFVLITLIVLRQDQPEGLGFWLSMSAAVAVAYIMMVASEIASRLWK